jgi:hypothetical protein
VVLLYTTVRLTPHALRPSAGTPSLTVCQDERDVMSFHQRATLGFEPSSSVLKPHTGRSEPYGRWNKSASVISCGKYQTGDAGRERGVRTYVASKVFLLGEDSLVRVKLCLELLKQTFPKILVRWQAELPEIHVSVSACIIACATHGLKTSSATAVDAKGSKLENSIEHACS